jgi:hypothetical protein
MNCDDGHHEEPCPTCGPCPICEDLIARVRAVERANAHVHSTGTSSGDGPCCQCCYDSHDLRAALTDLRESIARDIEARYSALNGDIGPTSFDEGLWEAVRIARGPSPEPSPTTPTRVSTDMRAARSIYDGTR